MGKTLGRAAVQTMTNDRLRKSLSTIQGCPHYSAAPPDWLHTPALLRCVLSYRCLHCGAEWTRETNGWGKQVVGWVAPNGMLVVAA